MCAQRKLTALPPLALGRGRRVGATIARPSFQEESDAANRIVELEIALPDGSKRSTTAAASETVLQLRYRMQRIWGVQLSDTVLCEADGGSKLLDPLSLCDVLHIAGSGSLNTIRLEVRLSDSPSNAVAATTASVALPSAIEVDAVDTVTAHSLDLHHRNKQKHTSEPPPGLGTSESATLGEASAVPPSPRALMHRRPATSALTSSHMSGGIEGRPATAAEMGMASTAISRTVSPLGLDDTDVAGNGEDEMATAVPVEIESPAPPERVPPTKPGSFLDVNSQLQQPEAMPTEKAPATVVTIDKTRRQRACCSIV